MQKYKKKLINMIDNTGNICKIVINVKFRPYYHILHLYSEIKISNEKFLKTGKFYIKTCCFQTLNIFNENKRDFNVIIQENPDKYDQ